MPQDDTEDVRAALLHARNVNENPVFYRMHIFCCLILNTLVVSHHSGGLPFQRAAIPAFCPHFLSHLFVNYTNCSLHHCKALNSLYVLMCH